MKKKKKKKTKKKKSIEYNTTKDTAAAANVETIINILKQPQLTLGAIQLRPR